MEVIDMVKILVLVFALGICITALIAIFEHWQKSDWIKGKN
jgi:hypothetical protein